jgi:imidazolonepropionase-like amidohydrolase
MVCPGVKIAFGTDASVFPHGQNAHEFELLTAAGLPPVVALQTATINAARLLKHENDLGSITVGKSADLIAVTGYWEPAGRHQSNEARRFRDEGWCGLQA